MSSEQKKRPVKILYSDLVCKPYADFGRGPEAYDCYGVVIEVFRRAGHEFPDWGSLRWKACRQIAERIAGHMAEFEPIEKPQILDLVLMWRERADVCDHLGVMVERGYFLHTTTEGVQCCRVDDPNWQGRISGFYRWKGLAGAVRSEQ